MIHLDDPPLPPSVNKVARVCLQEGEGQLSHPLMNTPSPEFCFVFTKRWPIMPVCGLSSKLYLTVINLYFFVFIIIFVLEMTCPRTGVTLQWSSAHRALNGTHFAPWSNKCPNVLSGIVALHKSKIQTQIQNEKSRPRAVFKDMIKDI